MLRGVSVSVGEQELTIVGMGGLVVTRVPPDVICVGLGWHVMPEDMPPDGEYVLVTDGHMADVAAYDYEDALWHRRGKKFKLKITHWMALPELPRQTCIL